MPFHRLLLPALPIAAALAAAAAALLPCAARAGDGDIDPAFAPTGNALPGWERLYFGAQDEHGVAAARNADGSIIVCLSVPGGTDGAKIGLFKLDANGHRVSAFGSSGQVLKDAALKTVTDMTIDAQGRIVVVGTTPGPGGTENFGVVRFNPDGSDDTSFAGDGGVSIGFDDTSGAIPTYYQDLARSVATDPDGKVVVAGSIFSNDGNDVRWGLIRLREDGSLDARVAGRYAQNQKAVGTKVLRLPNGHYLVVGSTLVAADDADFGARIVKPSLTVDSSYSDAGSFAFDVAAGDGSLSDFASDAALAAGGRVVLAGVASTRIAANRILVLADGSGNPATLALDTSFVGGGSPTYAYNYVSALSSTDVDPGHGTARTRVAVRSDDSILLSGRFTSTSTSESSAMLTRLRADGSEDADFAALLATRFYQAPTGAGSASTDSGFDDVLVDGGSRPLLVGTSRDNTGDMDGVVTRLQSDLIFADAFE
ncbi:hypothetical protein [Dokdonella fugitiva]|jgi:uncharacterized delta-60 repeat protein|uniref:Putative delta-60 repeat protein n=1 Tax=Dokdonella fugitiva TaxID=328517 RepID=A0A4V2S2D6_9GAMM|nr:hypothetical protein [Dokdonella fugitiva]TCO40050.1 putative delta-60 repeat protein [Dokdonella fugitiva]